MVGCVSRPQGIGNDVGSRTGMGEDNRLTMEALRRDPGIFLGAEALDGRYLLLVLDKDEVSFEGYRPVIVPDKRSTQFLCEYLRDPDSSREVEELGFRGKVLQPRNQTVKAVTTVRILEHLHLVDDHGPDGREPLSGPDKVVHTLIGSHDDRSPDVSVADRSILRQLDAGLPYEDPDTCDLPVPLFKTLVLLDSECHQGDEEQGVAPSFQMVLEARHLPNEGLPARCGRDDQKMLSVQQACIHRHLLCRHECFHPCNIYEFTGKGKLRDTLRFLHGVGFESIKECPGYPYLFRLNACKHLLHITEIFKELLKVPKCLGSNLTHGGEFPPQFPPCTIETDLLPGGVTDAVFPVQGSNPVLHEADPAHLCMGEGDLEIMKKCLEMLIILGQVYRRLPERDHELLRGGGTELVLPAPFDPVMARPVPLCGGIYLGDPHRPDLQIVKKQDLICSFLRLDYHVHGAIRSWRT